MQGGLIILGSVEERLMYLGFGVLLGMGGICSDVTGCHNIANLVLVGNFVTATAHAFM